MSSGGGRSTEAAVASRATRTLRKLCAAGGTGTAATGSSGANAAAPSEGCCFRNISTRWWRELAALACIAPRCFRCCCPSCKAALAGEGGVSSPCCASNSTCVFQADAGCTPRSGCTPSVGASIFWTMISSALALASSSAWGGGESSLLTMFGVLSRASICFRSSSSDLRRATWRASCAACT